MILPKISKRFDVVEQASSETFVSTTNIIRLLDKRENFKEDLKRIFKLDEANTEIFQIGNAKQLVEVLIYLDSLCEKIDIDTKIKDVYLKKMFEDEKAIFDIFHIDNEFILKQNKTDLLSAETRYSAKNDILDYFHLSKFANYCRDKEYEDLVGVIKDYLKKKNGNNDDPLKLRLVYVYEEEKFYIRAMTSVSRYKDYGINFSVLVALVTLGRYVEQSQNNISIEYFNVDDSEIYVSFRILNEIPVDKKLLLSINLILENDEIKRSSVSFNGVCKLKYMSSQGESEIYIKPKGIKKPGQSYTVDILNYPHSISIEKVYEYIENLPTVFDQFLNQVKEDVPRIANIKNTDDVRKLIVDKVKKSKKQEFQSYKPRILNKLMSITVDNIFNLFELLRDVEELFEHEDIISRDFWRTKLYEALIEKK